MKPIHVVSVLFVFSIACTAFAKGGYEEIPASSSNDALVSDFASTVDWALDLKGDQRLSHQMGGDSDYFYLNRESKCDGVSYGFGGPLFAEVMHRNVVFVRLRAASGEMCNISSFDSFSGQSAGCVRAIRTLSQERKEQIGRVASILAGAYKTYIAEMVKRKSTEGTIESPTGGYQYKLINQLKKLRSVCAANISIPIIAPAIEGATASAAN